MCEYKGMVHIAPMGPSMGGCGPVQHLAVVMVLSVTDSHAVYPVLPMWWCVVAGSNVNPVIADIETTGYCMPANCL